MDNNPYRILAIKNLTGELVRVQDATKPDGPEHYFLQLWGEPNKEGKMLHLLFKGVIYGERPSEGEWLLCDPDELIRESVLLLEAMEKRVAELVVEKAMKGET